MEIRLNPAVRIHPPSEVIGDRWSAENILTRTRFTVSPQVAAALVAAARPQTPEELARGLAAATAEAGRAPIAWAGLIDGLRERDLLVDDAALGTDAELDWLVDVRRRWSEHGWHEAAEYHTLTFDYPCVDYTAAIAILEDRDRMRGYQSDEPDTDRFKLDYADRSGIALPELDEDLITTSARDVWAGEVKPVPLDLEKLRTVVAAAFGITGWIVPKTDSAPLLRRSSPSGGARNPTEGYVVVRDVPGIDPGWYHVTMQPFSLRRVGELPVDDDSLRRLFPNTVQRFPAHARALLVLTCTFERNMYRYREPRTYRTVHMDAGHVANAFRVASRAAGLTSAIFYCDAATEIEAVLGLDGMAEGYMLTVAVADGQDEELRIPARRETSDV
ncbi:SagB/ThcOx family dehydrogenase [Actinoplanes sp. RD1]|uniref:SagB/ThcOx family dehydrogenase n=1 Tax=Actinoplanes sp. RD1 TaxID=3064538 RepID=UPI002740C5F4|nr:SagB/ThcOx family dehydrogenase [Actinoplanes sp. RD1]